MLWESRCSPRNRENIETNRIEVGNATRHITSCRALVAGTASRAFGGVAPWAALAGGAWRTFNEPLHILSGMMLDTCRLLAQS
jgi:hypothetical protein